MVKKLRMLLGLFFRKKYVKVYIVKKVEKRLQVINIEWINIAETDFIIGKHTYEIDLEEVILTKSGKCELIYDQGNTKPLIFNEKPSNIDNKRLTSIMKTRLFQEILFHKREKQFFIIIGFLVMVIVAVGIYGMYNVQQSQEGFLETIERIFNSTRGLE